MERINENDNFNENDEDLKITKPAGEFQLYVTTLFILFILQNF